MRGVDRSAKSIALCFENIRPSEDGRDQSLESRNVRSAYLFGDRLICICV